MNRIDDGKVIPKIHWLTVSNEVHIATVKELEGIEHHIPSDEFFTLLEQLQKEHPRPIDFPPIELTEPERAEGDKLPDLPDHVMSAMREMRKRRALAMDMPRLLQFWPSDWPGYPNLLVVSLSDSATGRTSRIPSVFVFLADTAIAINNGQASPIRQRGGETMFQKVAEQFPLDRSYIRKPRS